MADKPHKMSTFEEMIRDGVSPIRQINTDAQLLRKSAVTEARGGRPAPVCDHPLHAVEQFVDEQPGMHPRAVNLWQCTICHEFIWLVDSHGKAVADS